LDRVGAVWTERGHRAFAIDFPVDQPDLLADDYAQIAVAQLPDDVHEPLDAHGSPSTPGRDPVIEVDGDHCPHIAPTQRIADILTEVK
jgi:hypothetical protein